MPETESEARALGLRVQSLKVRKFDAFENVFQSAKKERAGAVLLTTNPMFSTHIARIAGLTIKYRLRLTRRKRNSSKRAG